jgi:hypothetical protein
MVYLTSTTALLGLSLVVVSLIIVRIREFARLKHIPGPAAAGWTDLWMIRAQGSGRMHLILQDAINKYGKCFSTIL